MTTTVMPPVPDAPARDPLRLLSISADLLPPEVVAVRRGRRVRAIVLVTLVGFVALLAAWYSTATLAALAAQENLTTAKATEQTLSERQGQYTELTAAQAETTAIENQLADLLAGDLRWSSLLAAIRRSAPAGTQVASITGSLSDVTGQSIGTRLPNTSGQDLVGELTIEGKAAAGSGRSAKENVAAYVDALLAIEGLGNPLLNDATEEDGTVTFTVRVDITKLALGGRYTTVPDKEGN